MEINYIDVCRAKIFPSTTINRIKGIGKQWWADKIENPPYKFHEGEVLVNKTGTPTHKIKIIGLYEVFDENHFDKHICYQVEVMRNEYKKNVPLSHYYSYTQKFYFLIAERVDNLFKLDPAWVVKQICD